MPVHPKRGCVAGCGGGSRRLPDRNLPTRSGERNARGDLLLPRREAEDGLASLHVAAIHFVACEKAEVFSVMGQQRDLAGEAILDHVCLGEFRFRSINHLVLARLFTPAREGTISERDHRRRYDEREEDLIQPGKESRRRRWSEV